MPRTTSAAVEAIIDVDDEISLTPFIEVANSLVTEVCVPGGYDDTRLELIERWLSAHFYAVRDPRAVSEQAGSVQESYESRVDLYFNITRYGQQALLLDTKGGLAKLQENIKNGLPSPPAIQIAWLGKDYSEEYP